MLFQPPASSEAVCPPSRPPTPSAEAGLVRPLPYPTPPPPSPASVARAAAVCPRPAALAGSGARAVPPRGSGADAVSLLHLDPVSFLPPWPFLSHHIICKSQEQVRAPVNFCLLPTTCLCLTKNNRDKILTFVINNFKSAVQAVSEHQWELA